MTKKKPKQIKSSPCTVEGHFFRHVLGMEPPVFPEIKKRVAKKVGARE
jgi:hypothetical protein